MSQRPVKKYKYIRFKMILVKKECEAGTPGLIFRDLGSEYDKY